MEYKYYKKKSNSITNKIHEHSKQCEKEKLMYVILILVNEYIFFSIVLYRVREFQSILFIRYLEEGSSMRRSITVKSISERTKCTFQENINL